jgi:antitoxin CptB
LENERYINDPTAARVAGALHGVKPLAPGYPREPVQPMTDDIEMRRRRAAYRASHRGTKEMDFILGRFAQAQLSGMTAEELGDFERLIALPDPILSEWFSQGAAPGDGEFAGLVAALRRYHGLPAAADTQSEV